MSAFLVAAARTRGQKLAAFGFLVAATALALGAVLDSILLEDLWGSFLAPGAAISLVLAVAAWSRYWVLCLAAAFVGGALTFAGCGLAVAGVSHMFTPGLLLRIIALVSGLALATATLALAGDLLGMSDKWFSRRTK